VLFLRGRVASPDGTPLAGVELDVWQADAAGHNSNIHPNMPEWNLRGRFHSGSDGTFEVRTIVPAPYEIPKGGPTGAVLSALGRHCFRPLCKPWICHPAFVVPCVIWLLRSAS